MKKEEEQQAFPTSGYDGPEAGGSNIPGMTLRQYYMGQAMVGIIISDPNTEGKKKLNSEEVAELAEDYVNAMIRQD